MSDTRITQYGFEMGPMVVERIGHLPPDKGWALFISTEHAGLEVHVSEKGRVIRTFDRPDLAHKQQRAWAEQRAKRDEEATE